MMLVMRQYGICDICSKNHCNFRNSNVYQHPSNETLRELRKRLALDVELYLFARQRLFTIHEITKM